MKALPNLMTGLRLALALFVFFALATAAGDTPGLEVSGGAIFALDRWAVFAFVVAAVTDFFDGWLARRLDATASGARSSIRSPTRCWSAPPCWG